MYLDVMESRDKKANRAINTGMEITDFLEETAVRQLLKYQFEVMCHLYSLHGLHQRESSDVVVMVP